MSRSLQQAAARGDIAQFDEAVLGYLGNVGDYDKEHALLRAAFNGKEAIVRRLLGLGVTPDCESVEVGTPFILAATNNHLGVLRILTQAGCDINRQADRDRGALHMAVINDHHAAIDYLIKCGCKLNLEDNFGDTPLMVASRRGYANTLLTLLKAGGKIGVRSHGKDTALHYAAQYGYTECIRCLLLYQPDLEASTIWGHTPLLVAAIRGYDEASLILLQTGANCTIGDRSGRTVLHYFAKNGLHKSITYLLKSTEASTINVVNAKDFVGLTPLFDAIHSRDLDIARTLIQHGADVRVVAKTTIKQSYQYWSILDIALELEEEEIADLILLCGATLADIIVYKDFSEKNVIYENVISRLKQPLLLTELCRVLLRNAFMASYQRMILTLHLPKTIKSFLMFE